MVPMPAWERVQRHVEAAGAHLGREEGDDVTGDRVGGGVRRLLAAALSSFWVTMMAAILSGSTGI